MTATCVLLQRAQTEAGEVKGPPVQYEWLRATASPNGQP